MGNRKELKYPDIQKYFQLQQKFIGRFSLQVTCDFTEYKFPMGLRYDCADMFIPITFH